MSRRLNITQKIDKDATGLNASMFVHGEYEFWHGKGRVVDVRFSNKKKESDHTLDRICTVLGDVVSDILQNLPEKKKP